MENDKPEQLSTPNQPQLPSAWPQILASLAFSCATFWMLKLYSLVHWKIMFNRVAYPTGESKIYVYELLNSLATLRVVFAILAISFALWSQKGRPTIGSAIAMACAVMAMLTILIIM